MADFAKPTAEDRYRMTRAAQRVLRKCGRCGKPIHIGNLIELKTDGAKVCSDCFGDQMDAALAAAGIGTEVPIGQGVYCDHGEPNNGADCIACAMWERVR